MQELSFLWTSFLEPYLHVHTFLLYIYPELIWSFSLNFHFICHFQSPASPFYRVDIISMYPVNDLSDFYSWNIAIHCTISIDIIILFTVALYYLLFSDPNPAALTGTGIELLFNWDNQKLPIMHFLLMSRTFLKNKKHNLLSFYFLLSDKITCSLAPSHRTTIKMHWTTLRK